MASGLLFLLLLGIGGNMFSEADPNHLIICEHSTIHLVCGKPLVSSGLTQTLQVRNQLISLVFAGGDGDAGMNINVESADYGRHDSTTCSSGHPPSELEDTSCSTLSNIVAENCNGHNLCSITASNDVFGDPCVGTYKYLDVAYECTS